MERWRHPETGLARRRARDSLFGLMVGSVLLAIVVEGVVNVLWSPRLDDPRWWAGLGELLVLLVALVYVGIRWDDRRIGEAATEVELLLPYVTVGKRERVSLGARRSYAVTTRAREAWAARYPQGLSVGEREGPFTRRVLPEHMDLVRYLLMVLLAPFGRYGRSPVGAHGWLRLEVACRERAWEDLPELLRANPFAAAVGRARPQKLYLPAGTRVEAFDEGEIVLRLRWRPTRRRWLLFLLGLGRWSPGGEVRVRWLGPLSEVRRYDKRYEHLTARLKDLPTEAEVHVVVTRLVVEVESRWNALEEVARFRDWAVNLALYLRQGMDYWSWRQAYLERQVDDLDWKIGWMAKGEEPSLAERLRRIDERLARLEAHLWPDEPAEGGGVGTWMSG